MALTSLWILEIFPFGEGVENYRQRGKKPSTDRFYEHNTPLLALLPLTQQTATPNYFQHRVLKLKARHPQLPRASPLPLRTFWKRLVRVTIQSNRERAETACAVRDRKTFLGCRCIMGSLRIINSRIGE